MGKSRFSPLRIHFLVIFLYLRLGTRAWIVTIVSTPGLIISQLLFIHFHMGTTYTIAEQFMIILRANYEETVGYWAVITPWLTNGCVLGKLPPLQLPQDPPRPCATQRCAPRGFLGHFLGQLHCLQGLHDFLRFNCRPWLGSGPKNMRFVPDSPFKRASIYGPKRLEIKQQNEANPGSCGICFGSVSFSSSTLSSMSFCFSVTWVSSISVSLTVTVVSSTCSSSTTSFSCTSTFSSSATSSTVLSSSTTFSSTTFSSSTAFSSIFSSPIVFSSTFSTTCSSWIKASSTSTFSSFSAVFSVPSP